MCKFYKLYIGAVVGVIIENIKTVYSIIFPHHISPPPENHVIYEKIRKSNVEQTRLQTTIQCCAENNQECRHSYYLIRIALSQ